MANLRLGLWGCGVALTRWLARPNSPDGFDSIDFLLGMSRKFDLAKLQPHFPGYPVFVALGAGLCRLGAPPLEAATAISAISSGVAAVALAFCARRLAGWHAEAPRASLNDPGLTLIALHTVAWQPWLVGSGALSDSLGIALAALAFALCGAERPRPLAGGLAAGLLLGARASYWPLAGALLLWQVRRRSWRALAGFGVGLAGWAVPFFAKVGVGSFVELGVVHLKGHFGAWGGSVATQPHVLDRAGAMVRDIFFDGFVPSVWAAATVAVIAVASFLISREQRTPPGPLPVRPILYVLVPYAVWVFVAQNVTEQPRHALPLVAGLLLVGALAMASRPYLLASTCGLALLVNVPLLVERQRVPPAGAQAAAWVAQNAAAGDCAVMAGRSWRFFTDGPAGATVRQHTWLSEVLVDLTRFDRLPTSIFLTSEVDLHSGMGARALLPKSWRVEDGPRFCRDARIDRADTCLGLSRLVWSP